MSDREPDVRVPDAIYVCPKCGEGYATERGCCFSHRLDGHEVYRRTVEVRVVPRTVAEELAERLSMLAGAIQEVDYKGEVGYVEELDDCRRDADAALIAFRAVGEADRG